MASHTNAHTAQPLRASAPLHTLCASWALLYWNCVNSLPIHKSIYCPPILLFIQTFAFALSARCVGWWRRCEAAKVALNRLLFIATFAQLPPLDISSVLLFCCCSMLLLFLLLLLLFIVFIVFVCFIVCLLVLCVFGLVFVVVYLMGSRVDALARASKIDVRLFFCVLFCKQYRYVEG